jgi:hypothetical protein
MPSSACRIQIGRNITTMKTKFRASVIGSALMFAAMTAGLATSAFARGNPIPGVVVKVQPSAEGKAIQVQTDAAGSFTVGPLKPGVYSIEILSWSWGASQSRVAQTSPDQSQTILITLEEEQANGRLPPLVSSQQTVRQGQSVSISFTVPAASGKAKQYTGHVTLMK